MKTEGTALQTVFKNAAQKATSLDHLFLSVEWTMCLLLRQMLQPDSGDPIVGFITRGRE